VHYRFGTCSLNVEERTLVRNGENITIPPQAFDLLVYLISNHHRVVSRDELIRFLWPGVFVSEWALSKSVHRLRKAIGSADGGQPAIQTFHGRGFRFVARVETFNVCVFADGAEVLRGVNGSAPRDFAGPFQDGLADSGSIEACLSAPLMPFEQRRVTVLCANLILQRQQLARMGIDRLAALRRNCHEAISSVVNGRGGFIASRFGTHLLVYFGYPHPDLDHAVRAVHSAQEIIKAIQTLDGEADNGGIAGITVQIGVHTGPVVIDEPFCLGMAFGEANTVSVARTLHRIAAPGTVLASHATLEFAVETKGIEERGPLTQSLTRLSGRRSESSEFTGGIRSDNRARG
jgi:DNA-binding winged helix-turn-helix (wHTH) protein/class 3 adenylate cyclase